MANINKLSKASDLYAYSNIHADFSDRDRQTNFCVINGTLSPAMYLNVRVN